MRTTTIWSLLLVAALVAITGQAAAQVFDDDLGAVGGFHDPLAVTPCDNADGILAVQDVEETAVRERSTDQVVDVEEDEILLAIALANNGAEDITWNKIRSVDRVQELFILESREADLDRRDVFSALALGLSATADSLEALACVSDVAFSHRETLTESRRVDLDDDTVLLAIALANSLHEPLDFEDIADISTIERVEVERDRIVDVDRNDAFLALALGAGGR